MMEKLCEACEGARHCTPTPFHYISTIMYKVLVYAPAEMADTLPLFLLFPYIHSLVYLFLAKEYVL